MKITVIEISIDEMAVLTRDEETGIHEDFEPLPEPQAEEEKPKAETKPKPDCGTQSATKTKTARRKPQPVGKIDLTDQSGSVRTFDDLKAAAGFLGINYKAAYDRLTRGASVNGFTLKRHSELDDCLREIEERNKQPYQFSK